MHTFPKIMLILQAKALYTMNNIAIFTLTSELHDAQTVNAATQEFLSSLGIQYDFHDADYSNYGTAPLNIIYVRTGGTEGQFRRLLPQLTSNQKSKGKPSVIYLLTSGKSNSLAASLEILSYLRQQGIRGEVIHGTPEHITRRIQLLEHAALALRQLQGCRVGVIGKPSDWLISSQADYDAVRQRTGIDIIDIPMQELLDEIQRTPIEDPQMEGGEPHIRKALPVAHQIYLALKTLVQKYQLQGLTIRCFDLLTAVHNTGCLALARLNSEGLCAGCEGDVPTLLTMMLSHAVTGISGFQANPAHINSETGEMLFAHCTIPFNMVEHFELDTHFESGIGVGIRGYQKPGPVTIFKVSGNLSRHFLAEGQLLRCEGKPDLCRTQQVIQLNNPEQARYFLTDPIGNHHVIVPGHIDEVMTELLSTL